MSPILSRNKMRNIIEKKPIPLRLKFCVFVRPSVRLTLLSYHQQSGAGGGVSYKKILDDLMWYMFSDLKIYSPKKKTFQ